MAPSHCPAKDDPHSEWPRFCPAVGPAYLYTVLFGLTFLTHFVQAITYRKGYCWVITMGAIWQTAAYIFRVLSIQHITNETFYILWFVLILLAPLWTNAFVYMVLGRMVYNYTSTAKILGVKAWRCTLIFVLLDILAFILQLTGAVMASGDDLTNAQIMRGLHIYMGGVGIQQFFILCFLFLAFRFQQRMKRDTPMASMHQPLALLYTIYAVLFLITVRIIFRLIEYAKGYETGIPTHEAYQYVFDSTAMLIALALLNVVHPGRIMPGKEADFPSRKQRKAAGKEHLWGRAGEQGGEGGMTYESSTSGQVQEVAEIKV
ncbi:uncharacterized protein KY384_008304 [Bacidia gigantensis]|uniref:uncharacterized protein n=1 Tax=Bacidia gigantensis TaxID=2732470 RepID=UPI001D042AA6|nr:uncharacterized protein KY384_008304 [Bacidia gigantensis]KAG8526875.1 hypothetical protein KY384_008304 [Bacidia gigantensis]